MPVPTLITELSTTAASNSPSGSDSPATIDDYLRANAAFIAQLRDGKLAKAGDSMTGLLGFKKGSDITAAATTDLGTATGNAPDVTHSSGTLAITSLGGASLQAGTEIATRFVITGGTLTLTHHATNLYLAGGANITLANGDVIRWRKMHSSNAEWKMVGGVKADGTAWVLPAADQVTMEAATSAVVTVTPASQHYHPSAAKAWVHFDAAGSLTASYNMTSVTDDGTGVFSPVWNVDFSSAAYCVLVAAKSVISGAATNINAQIADAGFTAGGCTVLFVDTATTVRDPTHGEVVAFGDQ